MRKSLLFAVIGWGVTAAVKVLFDNPTIIALCEIAAAVLTLLWIAHFSVYTLKLFIIFNKRFSEPRTSAEAAPPVSRRSALSVLARAVTVTAIATAGLPILARGLKLRLV
jgi:hypothetical protein